MQYFMYKLFSIEIVKYLKYTNRASCINKMTLGVPHFQPENNLTTLSYNTLINMVLCYIFMHIRYQSIIKTGR